MIKFLFKYLTYFIFFIFCIFLFLPKENIYYMMEKKLFEYKTIVSYEKINSGIFNFDVKNAYIFYDGIKFAKIQEVKTEMYLYEHKVQVKNFKLFDSFKALFPQNINNVEILHNVLTPKEVTIKAEGDFGLLDGKVDLVQRKLKLFLKASSIMKKKYKSILKQMKLKNGKYEYEYQF